MERLLYLNPDAQVTSVPARAHVAQPNLRRAFSPARRCLGAERVSKTGRSLVVFSRYWCSHTRGMALLVCGRGDGVVRCYPDFDVEDFVVYEDRVCIVKYDISI